MVAFVGIFQTAIGLLISCIVSIEANTRATHELLNRHFDTDIGQSKGGAVKHIYQTATDHLNYERESYATQDIPRNILLSPTLVAKVERARIPHDYDPREVTDHFPMVVKLRFE